MAGTGCWHTAHEGPPPWPHILTCYGGCQAPHYDPSACGGSTACCSKCIDGTWWYSTEQQIFGCGAKLEIRHGNKCVVVQVADNGPASWVEANAAGKCGGSGDIIDTSPLVADYFGGGCGWSQCFWVDVRPVPKSMPQGICPTCPCGGECKPGEVQGQGCGNCGWMERTCGGDSKWGGWGPCVNQGPCSPGQIADEACGDCGSHSRVCDGACQWTDWSPCQGPDPGDGKLPCDTGEPGVCQPGLQKCLDGWVTCKRLIEPAEEVCDDMDNDCDGPVDEGEPQVVGSAMPAYAARLEDLSFPMALPAGAQGRGWVEFANAGTHPWKKGEIWLKAEGDTPGSASVIGVPGDWPAFDVAAVLAADVEPGGLARLEFSVTAPGEGESPGLQRFRLLRPDGETMKCPAPGFELSIRPLSNAGWLLESPTEIEPPADAVEQTGDDLGGSPAPATGCNAAGSAGESWPLLGMLLPWLAFRRGRRRGTRTNGPAQTCASGTLQACLLACLLACSSTPSDKPGDVVEEALSESVESVTPRSGTAQGGELVAVAGTGFVEGVEVRFGETKAATVKWVGPDELQVLTPPLTAGVLDLVVAWPGGKEVVLHEAFEALKLELRFVDVPSFSFPSMPEMDTRAGAVGDMDKDGDLDVILVAPGRPVTVLANDGNGNFEQSWPPVDEPPVEPVDERGGIVEGADVATSPEGDASPYPANDVVSQTDWAGDGPAGPPADAGPLPADVVSPSDGGQMTDAGTGSDAEPGIPEIPLHDARDVLTADLDHDGCLDVFVVCGPAGTNALLKGDCSGKLADVSGKALPPDSGDFGRAFAADMNGDGRLDLLVANLAPGAAPQDQNRLYLQNSEADMVFEPAPVDLLPVEEESTAAVTPVDVDLDGDQDLVLANLTASDGTFVRLLLSQSGGFSEAPIGMLPRPPAAVSLVVAGDVDGDQDPDLIAISPAGQDRLYRNDGSGHFFDDTLIAMPLDKSAGSAGVLRDLDRDGLPDLVIGNAMHQNRLYLNDGKGAFHDYTPLLPIAQLPTTGVLALDGDGDHDVDLLFLNGAGTGNRLLLNVRP